MFLTVKAFQCLYYFNPNILLHYIQCVPHVLNHYCFHYLFFIQILQIQLDFSTLSDLKGLEKSLFKNNKLTFRELFESMELLIEISKKSQKLVEK